MSIFSKIFAIILAVLAFFGCAKPKPDPTPAPAPDSYTVDGSKVEFCFDSNPTTGFNWKYELSGNCIVLTNSKYVPDNNDRKLSGVGGLQYYDFTAVHQGTAKVTFTYIRDFEPDGYKRVFVAEISVDENNNITVTDFSEKAFN